MSEKKHEATGWYRWKRDEGVYIDQYPFNTHKECLEACEDGSIPLYLEATEPPQPRELWRVDWVDGGFSVFDRLSALPNKEEEHTVTRYIEVIE